MFALGPVIGDRVHISLRPSPSFDFALTARVLRRSTRNVIDRVDDEGTWSRVVALSRGPALLRSKQHGPQAAFDAAPVRVEDGRIIEMLVRRLFSLDSDIAPFW